MNNNFNVSHDICLINVNIFVFQKLNHLKMNKFKRNCSTNWNQNYLKNARYLNFQRVYNKICWRNSAWKNVFHWKRWRLTCQQTIVIECFAEFWWKNGAIENGSQFFSRFHTKTTTIILKNLRLFFFLWLVSCISFFLNATCFASTP